MFPQKICPKYPDPSKLASFYVILRTKTPRQKKAFIHPSIWRVKYFGFLFYIFLDNKLLLISINLKTPKNPAIQLPPKKWYFPKVFPGFFQNPRSWNCVKITLRLHCGHRSWSLSHRVAATGGVGGVWCVLTGVFLRGLVGIPSWMVGYVCNIRNQSAIMTCTRFFRVTFWGVLSDLFKG